MPRSNLASSRATLHMRMRRPPSWHMYPRMGSHWYLLRHFTAWAPARGAMSVAVTARIPFLAHPRMADWRNGMGDPKGSRST